MRKINLVTGVLLISMMLLSACSTPDRRVEGATISDPRDQAVSAKLSPLVSPLHLTYILDDRIEYAIDSVKKSKSLGEMKNGRTASGGNFFYIVSFRARNAGHEVATIATDAITVRSGNHEPYRTSPAGKEAVTLNGGPKDLFEAKLVSGELKPFLAIFDLPPYAVESGASFVIPSTMAGSGDRWDVPLDNSTEHR